MRENSLLQRGQVGSDATIKVAQTFRTETNDIDAIDFVEMFLKDEQEVDLDHLNEVYVLENFRPLITNKNWRMDCGVAGYDNTYGLPPFFPTRLRFEDYIHRLWLRLHPLPTRPEDGVHSRRHAARSDSCPRCRGAVQRVYRHSAGLYFDAQRRPLPGGNWQATVYHGLPRDLHTFQPDSGTCAFIGRISADKRLDRAIEIARRAGMPLKVAAKIYDEDRAYFEGTIAPLLHEADSRK